MNIEEILAFIGGGVIFTYVLMALKVKHKELENLKQAASPPPPTDTRNKLRRKFQVAIVGSTEHYDPITKEICEKLGSQLARYKDVTLITGGTSGIPESVCDGWYNYTGSWDGITHFFPRTGVEADRRTNAGGDFVIACETAEERQVLLSEFADIMIMLGGGDGTGNEVKKFLKKYKNHESPKLVVTVPFSSPMNREVHEQIDEDLRGEKYSALEEVRRAWCAFASNEPDYSDVTADRVVRYIMYCVSNELRLWNQKTPVEPSTLKDF